MDKVFDSKKTEELMAERWKGAGAYNAEPEAAGDPYAIVIPPPNVTAALHLGHALNNTLQDILIRWARMRGCNTLWMPGTDHAGIATQTVVEKRLLKDEGTRRTDMKREDFVARVQSWKDEYEGRILGQLDAMGCSCDWRRTRFTMDEVCAKSVRAVFFKLFSDGLIERGYRLVNWDPATQTVLADDEVEHEKVDGSFWYLRYPLTEAVTVDGKEIHYVVVATTRPETMLGDTGIAINPRDPRASALVGKTVRLPIVDRLIPIVADDHVVLPDPDSDDEKARFSSGCLKVTPAHDVNDWEIGLRHKLDVINVMAPDGSISADHGFEDHAGARDFIGMDRFKARKAIVAWFDREGLLHDVRPYSHEVGHSYRSHVPIEPYLSRQWYVAVKKPIPRLAEAFGEGVFDGTDVPRNSLAGLALGPFLDGRVSFVPERYGKTYQSWLENLRDWPISRQLWWGHQIPVWRKPGTHGIEAAEDAGGVVTIDEDGEMISYACVAPGHEELEAALATDGWERDEDVLDTWFSSALWPFSTLGWPEETPELAKFYPGSVLCTAREIITLWVSRMVMMGQYCLGDIPFSDVFIHAMIQDGEGRKMSKSLGNGIDPLDIIDSHGADAMRFTLCQMTTQTQDVRMPVDAITLPDGRVRNTSPKFDIGRKLCTKLWNAARFVLEKLEGGAPWSAVENEKSLADAWILSRLSQTLERVDAALRAFRFSDVADELYHFLYDDYCDWYVEIAKGRIQDGQAAPKAVLAFVLDQFLRAFHPIAPFISEAIWAELGAVAPKRGPTDEEAPRLLVTAAYPQARAADRDEEAERRFAVFQDLVRQVRNARKTNGVPPRKALDAIAEAGEEGWLEEAGPDLVSQAVLSDLSFRESGEPPADAGIVTAGSARLFVLGLVDKEAERKRLDKKASTLQRGIKASSGKLGNKGFVDRAPAEVVERERARLKEMEAELAAVEEARAALG